MHIATNQKGAALTEYALGILLFVVVLIPVTIGLTLAATNRANESLSTVKQVAPCSNRLAPLGQTYAGHPQVIDEVENPELTADLCN